MNTTAPATAPAAPARRWPKRFLWMLGFAGLAWFAPAIIANSPWRDYAINSALGKINGRVVTKSASLWWLAPVNVTGLRFDDNEGKPLVDVAEIRISRSLLSLLLDRTNLGEIRLEKPSIYLALSEKSSNLQDALSPLLEHAGGTATPSLSIVIDNGSVTMEDLFANKSWELRDLAAEFQAKSESGFQYTFKAKGTLNTPGGAPAMFDSSGEFGAEPAKELAGEVRLIATKLPLDALTPWLRRMPDPIRIDGALSGEATYRWTSAKQHALGLKQVTAETLGITAPKQLGPSQILLSKLAATGKLALDADRIVFEGFSLDTTAAKVEATGGANLTLLSHVGDLSHLGVLLRDEDLNFKAEIDVAEAAKAFPDFLRIREGTEITSGKVTFDLDSTTQGETRRWLGGIKTNSLTATNAGKSIVWEKPVDLSFKAHKGNDGIVIDDFQCDSSFLKVSGTATTQEGRFHAEADLSALHGELSRFADIGDIQLRGKMNAHIDWRQGRGDVVQAIADARIENFAIQAPNQKPWEERELTIQSTINLKLDGSQIIQATSGDVALVSGSDRISLVLLSPVPAPFAAAKWPLRVEGSGKLESWKSRLQNFLPLADWELAGQFTAQAEGQFSSNEITWRSARGTVQQLRAFGASLYIQEPRMELLESKGSVNLASGEMELDQLTAQGSSISLLAEKFAIRPTAGDLLLTGRLDYEAKLDALQAWTHHPKLPPEIVIQGRAKGTLIADTGAKSANIDYSLEVAPLTIAKAVNVRAAPRADVAAAKSAPRHLNVLWREQQLESSGRVEYDLSSGQTRLEGVKLQGDAIAATLTGVIREIATRCVADLSGEVEYDADKLSPLLAAASGMDIQISGHRTEQIAIRGPLMAAMNSFGVDYPIPAVMQSTTQGAPPRGPIVTASSWPRELQADASAGWSKALLAGLSTGPVEIDAKLREGQVRIKPLDIELAAGTLRLSPIFDLAARPYLVRFAPGPIIENAAITPQLCRSWLKYVNPLMADVTEAEGSFSLELGDSAFPLAQPILGEANGMLTLNQAQVGPGPLSRELIEIGKQVEAVLKSRPPGNVKTWLTMPRQEVRFAVQGGRVFHERITFQARDIVITTSGSVGVDQSIQILAEVPIKDEWVAKEKLLSGLKGQSLQIPIGGTLTEPKVDPRAISEIGARAIGGAVRGRLEDELDKGIQKGLDKLLRPKK